MSSRLAFLVSLLVGSLTSQTRAADPLRTLDEIPIEGALDMPQVWFVTARELPRFHDRIEWLLDPRAAAVESLLVLPVVRWPREGWALPDSIVVDRGLLAPRVSP
ncbi:MAG: hypothetical protein U0527_08885 [Candidatus Eisenbacteria bacterium]